ncbi:hypothetical protein KR009_004379, partial [Drosophila setifemur]
MATEKVGEYTDLIICKSRSRELELPEVKRIKDIREFMTDKNNFDGDLDGLVERMMAKTDQCEDVQTVLKDKLELKLATLRKVKTDMLELSEELKKPGATQRFGNRNEKICIHFLDEMDMNEFDIPSALERFSVKMGTLYNEIVALDSDVDYVNFLKGISRLNIQYVREWYQAE